jgi:rhodanese-related sulfurtransferase
VLGVLGASVANIAAQGLSKGAIMQHSPEFLKIVNDAKSRVPEVTVEDVQHMQQSGETFEFIDCREDNEWTAGRAAGARHLGKGIIERDIETAVPDKSAKVVIYCGGGFRSALAGDALQKMGYTNILSMAGGIKAWRDAALPEEKG